MNITAATNSNNQGLISYSVYALNPELSACFRGFKYSFYHPEHVPDCAVLAHAWNIFYYNIMQNIIVGL